MRDIRYKYHFTPDRGWINDPNGLIYVEGVYHIFFQYYPNDTIWGPMHWGHAVSRDLLSWEQQPIALYPTEDEYIFSGSAILDCENVSGLGDGKAAPMLLFYTSHNPKTGEQKQSMAYSLDYVNFNKYSHNPVIDNKKYLGDAENPLYKKDFRDPRVFRNNVKGGFTMALAVGRSIEFYHSDNLMDWSLSGKFLPESCGYGGICECPDLFYMTAGSEGKYVITMSMVFDDENEPDEVHLMQYFIGDFDGNTFINTQAFEKSQLLDFGKYNYAMVSFSGRSDIIMIGWGEDWNRARRNTNKEHFGKMTLARTLELVKCDDRFLIRQEPVFNNRSYSNEAGWEDICLAEGSGVKCRDSLDIVNNGEAICINGKTIERSKRGECRIKVIYDCGYYELFIDDGIICVSQETQ